MSLTSDVVANAIAIANDNRFRYRYNNEGNGSGAVAVPYTMDCCTYISYSIYLAMNWTWYNQPYSYYWPHVDDAGFDYFLTNTMGCSKQLFSQVTELRAGDIIITDEYYGHTLMMISPTQFVDAIPNYNYGEAQSIAIRNYPAFYSPVHFLYLYRFPDSGTGDYLFNDDRGNFQPRTASGITFTWDTSEKPYKCTITGTATGNATKSPWQMNILNSPFRPGETYRLKFKGTNVSFRAYFYDQNINYSNPRWTFTTYNDMTFTIPDYTLNFVFRLYVANGVTINETVAPEINIVPEPLPDIPPIEPTNIIHHMPVWMMLNPFL